MKFMNQIIEAINFIIKYNAYDLWVIIIEYLSLLFFLNSSLSNIYIFLCLKFHFFKNNKKKNTINLSFFSFAVLI